jgi:hypothetical protein
MGTTFLHGQSGASHPRQNRGAMFFSICVSEPDYAYILRRCCSTAVYDFTYGTGINL